MQMAPGKGRQGAKAGMQETDSHDWEQFGTPLGNMFPCVFGMHAHCHRWVAYCQMNEGYDARTAEVSLISPRQWQQRLC